MSGALKLEFAAISAPVRGILVMFCGEGLKFGAAAQAILRPCGDLVTRAAAAARFKGKNGSTLDILAPAGLAVPYHDAGRVGLESRSAPVYRAYGVHWDTVRE